MKGWIGVDLDGTLAFYDKWRGPDHIGEPIEAMVNRVKDWIADGQRVKIFTARVADDPGAEIEAIIHTWCVKHIGHLLEVTNKKDFGMIALWDDRCVRIVTNTGEKCCEND